jgi:hypothetical protein
MEPSFLLATHTSTVPKPYAVCNDDAVHAISYHIIPDWDGPHRSTDGMYHHCICPSCQHTARRDGRCITIHISAVQKVVYRNHPTQSNAVVRDDPRLPNAIGNGV